MAKTEEEKLKKEKRKEVRRTSRGHEILRFLIVGILATLIDFAVSY